MTTKKKSPASGKRRLFIDDSLIVKTENVKRRQGEAEKCPGNPILRRDRPWDASRLDLYGSAVYDPENERIQLYYSANNVPDGHEDRLAYAESYDQGKSWSKPEFAMIPFGKHRKTNLVMLPPAMVMHGPCVFRDEHEKKPAKRYKLFTSSYPDTAYLGIPRIYIEKGGLSWYDKNAGLPDGCGKPGMYTGYSPDGIHWTCAEKPFSDMLSDTSQSVFWDENVRKYVAYVRTRVAYPAGRSVARMESGDFETWTKPEVVLGSADEEIYSMGVMPYEDWYIGTPWVYDPDTDSGDGPAIWPELAFSRDGINWTRPFKGKPLIRTGPAGSPDSRQIRLANSWVVLEDRILLFYGQSARPHSDIDMQIDIGMAVLRLDGFAAMTAGNTAGSIVTKPLNFSGGHLYVNARTAASGYIRAEILDSDGVPLAGYSGADSIPFTGDSVRQELGWKNNARLERSGESGNSIRFVLQNAELYSFMME